MPQGNFKLHNLNELLVWDSRAYDTPRQALFLHLVRLPLQQQGYMDRIYHHMTYLSRSLFVTARFRHLTI